MYGNYIPIPTYFTTSQAYHVQNNHWKNIWDQGLMDSFIFVKENFYGGGYLHNMRTTSLLMLTKLC